MSEEIDIKISEDCSYNEVKEVNAIVPLQNREIKRYKCFVGICKNFNHKKRARFFIWLFGSIIFCLNVLGIFTLSDIFSIITPIFTYSLFSLYLLFDNIIENARVTDEIKNYSGLFPLISAILANLGFDEPENFDALICSEKKLQEIRKLWKDRLLAPFIYIRAKARPYLF